MNLQIINFYDKKTQINKDAFCIDRGGKNIQPIVTWHSIPPAKCYALVMEDPYSIYGNMVHWFVPVIYDNVCVKGLNSLNKFGYSGPCAPKNTGMRIYIFTLYSLDKIYNFDTSIQIKSSGDFEKILKNNGVKVLTKEMKSFYYDS